MNDITYAVSVDVNNPIIPYNVYVASVLDSNVRYLEITLYQNGNVIALGNTATATASLVTDNVLVDSSVNCTISDNIITVPLEDLQRHGNLDVQVTVIEGTKVLAIPFPIQVRVTPNIAEEAQVDENSMGSYAEVVQELADARGDYISLSEALNHKLSSAAGAVKTANIDTGAVTEAKLATDSVATAKIKDGNVTEAKLAAAFKNTLYKVNTIERQPNYETCDAKTIYVGAMLGNEQGIIIPFSEKDKQMFIGVNGTICVRHYTGGNDYQDWEPKTNRSQVFIGDTEPSDPNIVLWVDTSSGEPTPGTTNPVTNLTGTTTANSVTLSWQASSNATSYKIYQGNNLIDSTASTSYTVGGLTAGSTYTFGVVATGAGGDSTKVIVTLTTQEGGGGSLPAEYQEVTYVQIPANTEGAINTGIANSEVGKIQIGIEADYSQFQMLTYSAAEDNTGRGAPYIYNTINKTAMVGTPTNYVTSISPESSEYVGQTKKVDFSINVSSNDTKFILVGGGEPAAWAGSTRKIYYFRIYDKNDLLLVNYIPCYRKTDNKVGMYDITRDVFGLPWGGPWTKGADA